jgi:L-ascorbate metabolism protein UlaG (beta-lactamase superfamily)
MTSTTLLVALALTAAACDLREVRDILVERQKRYPPEITEARYVANSGVLLTIDGRRFLIDAPIRDGLPPYATSSADERARLENARPPYDNIDEILITHWHEDHFSAEAIARLLAASPKTTLMASSDVVRRVLDVAPHLARQTGGGEPNPGRSVLVMAKDVPVRILRIRHNETGRPAEDHLGFLIGKKSAVLHVGDADPAAGNFDVLHSLPYIDPLVGLPVDVAFLPYWYVTDEANRKVVMSRIRPQRIVAMHVPPAEVERVTAAVRAANVNAIVAGTPGTVLALPD